MNAPHLGPMSPAATLTPSAPLHLIALAWLAGLVVPADAAASPADDVLPPDMNDMAEAPEAGWVRSQLGAHDAPTPSQWLDSAPAEDARLQALARHFGLSLIECIAVALACAVEREPMVGRVLAWLQIPAGSARPTIGLCLTLAQWFELPDALGALACGTARDIGLLGVDDERRPLPEQALQVPLPIVMALHGRVCRWPGLVRVTPPGSVAASTRTAASAWARALADEITGEVAGADRHGDQHGPAALVVRSGHPAEALQGAALVCVALDHDAIAIESEAPPGLAAWLWLCRALPVFVIDAAPGEHHRLPPLPGHRGPLLLACGIEGSLEHQGLPLSEWRLPMPDAAERTALWQARLPELGAAQADLLGRTHRHGAARIERLAQAARRQARLDAGASDGSAPEQLARALHRVTRTGAASDLGHLAELLPQDVDDTALILGDELRQLLLALEQRCRHRERLADDLGPAARTRYRPGVRALLVGASGTGKTLAAAWLATRLGLPLYRVDLASLVSKYIGETEKNLAQLFARAEHAEVVLLFDEADALFGKRTDVKDSNDRFANQQTNYLLQRIEAFDGIALLTSNSRTRFDSAFTRRLDAILEFPRPLPEERRALWSSHLGAAHPLAASDINRLAAACDLAGGHIRNVVLNASAQALQDGRRIGYRDLADGIEAELRKLGRQAPAGLS